MKKAGYETAMIGKWHLDQEPAAFDYYCVLPGQGKYHDPDFMIRGNKPWPRNVITMEGKHSSDAITDLSLDWLSSKRDRNKPFFLMHHFKAPHDMFENAKRYDEYLEDVEIPEPDNLFNPPAGSEASKGMGSGVGRTHAPWNLARKLGVPDLPNDRDYAKAGYQKYLKRYLRCVKGVDDNIQRLIDYLKETGELDNTIIIYTSDHGESLYEHGLIEKHNMLEPAARVPFVIRAPWALPQGAVCASPASLIDLIPTLAEMTATPVLPLMKKRPALSVRRVAVTTSRRGSCSMRRPPRRISQQPALPRRS
jgi:arylsulfatase A-like enzyme